MSYWAPDLTDNLDSPDDSRILGQNSIKIGIASTHMWSESSFKNAGISRSSYRLIDRLSCQFPDDRITVFANSAFESDPSWKERPNLVVKPIVPSGRGKRAIWESFGAAREASTSDYDVWLSTTHAVPFRSRVPSVAIIHDMIPLLFPEYGDGLQVSYLRFALIHVAKKVTRIVTNSQQTKADILRFAKVDQSKVVVVPFGPGTDPKAKFNPRSTSPKRVQVPFSRFLLVIGTLEPRKNLGRLFQAMSLLTEPEFADVGLVVVGGRGWKEQGIFETVEELKLSDRIMFPGYVEDDELAELFATCAAFIFPSIYEGFGMPIVEAMQRGAPVLTSGVGAMKEVAGDAAAFFDPTSPESIATCIKDFLNLDPDRRCLQIQQGKQRSTLFTWDLAAEQTHRVLVELAEAA